MTTLKNKNVLTNIRLPTYNLIEHNSIIYKYIISEDQ